VTDPSFYLTFQRKCLLLPLIDINRMQCPDEKVIDLIRSNDRKAEHQAVDCMKDCVRQAHGVLLRMNAKDERERKSLINLAQAEFFIQVRQQKFVLTGQAKICSYMTEIAKRKWMEFSRRNKPMVFDLSFLTHAQEQPGTDHDALYAALQQLDDADRDILVSFYFYDMSLEDYAELNNINYDAAKKRISRARERLKKHIKPDEI